MKLPVFKTMDIVDTPEGRGVIVTQSTIGEYMINIPKKGMVYYYEEDLTIVREEELCTMNK